MSLSYGTRILSVLSLLALTVGTYMLVIRPSQLRWGASDEELARTMAGDELVAEPTFFATRAITINATPEEIWPWVVQMGHGRAGFYGYDLIENLGSPRGIRSADRIIEELQDLEVGDRVYMSAPIYLIVDSMDPPRSLVWADPSDPPTSALTWALYPVDEGRTRLVSRVRLRYHWTRPVIVIELFTDFADHVAVQKILHGVKDRVEGRVESMAIQTIEVALWAVAVLQLFAALILIFIRDPWWKGWLVAAAAAGTLLVALYLHGPLWIGVILEAGVCAGLWWVYRTR
ncbi:MAG: hypothetical protein R3344_01340 [Acidobacteriota bacterium]|nr:hypothetical protein [Acidobacteriota bacterium]